MASRNNCVNPARIGPVIVLAPSCFGLVRSRTNFVKASRPDLNCGRKLLSCNIEIRKKCIIINLLEQYDYARTWIMILTLEGTKIICTCSQIVWTLAIGILSMWILRSNIQHNKYRFVSRAHFHRVKFTGLTKISQCISVIEVVLKTAFLHCTV